MRRFAIFAVFASAYIAILGVLNLAIGFVGGVTFTVIAFVGASVGVLGAVETWKVSRRIERTHLADRSAKPS